MYTLLIKSSAERDLRKLPPTIFQRVNEKILALRDDPYPPGVRKLVGAIEGWRIRVGDYRILYQIDAAAQTVTIVRVKHRREVYR
jgi:mRNA interferase RelE/StbE